MCKEISNAKEAQYQEMNRLYNSLESAIDYNPVISTLYYVNLLESELQLRNRRRLLFELVFRVESCFRDDAQTAFSIYDMVWALLRLVESETVCPQELLEMPEAEFWPMVVERAATDRKLYS